LLTIARAMEVCSQLHEILWTSSKEHEVAQESRRSWDFADQLYGLRNFAHKLQGPGNIAGPLNLPHILPDSFKCVAFLAFCRWRENVRRRGKWCQTGIFSPNGEFTPVWENVPPCGNFFTFGENFLHLRNPRNFFAHKPSQANIFSKKFSGENFPSTRSKENFPQKNFRENVPQNTFLREYFSLKYVLVKDNIFPSRAKGENIPASVKGKIFPIPERGKYSR